MCPSQEHSHAQKKHYNNSNYGRQSSKRILCSTYLHSTVEIPAAKTVWSENIYPYIALSHPESSSTKTYQLVAVESDFLDLSTKNVWWSPSWPFVHHLVSGLEQTTFTVPSTLSNDLISNHAPFLTQLAVNWLFLRLSELRGYDLVYLQCSIFRKYTLTLHQPRKKPLYTRWIGWMQNMQVDYPSGQSSWITVSPLPPIRLSSHSLFQSPGRNCS